MDLFRGKASPRTVALAPLIGALVWAVTNAIAIAIVLPLPASGVGVRVLHHVFDFAQTLGMGLCAAVVLYVGTVVVRGVITRGMVLYALAASTSFYFILGRIFERQADAALNGTLAGVLFWVFVALVGMGVVAGHLLGAGLSSHRVLRWIGVAAGLGGVVVNHAIVPDDYESVHAAIGWIANLAIGAALAPLVESRMLKSERFPKSTAWRIGAAAFGALSLFGLLIPPPNNVRVELFREPGSSGAWALAMTVWELPPLPPPRAPDTGWFADRSALPNIPPTEPKASDSPIVVLITVDALRADVVLDPKHDAEWRNIAALKRTGTTFRMARSPGSQTSVSLATLFSGKYFSQLYWSKHGYGKSRFDYPAEDDTVRFPSLLSEAGVATSKVASINFLADEYGISRGFDDVVVVPDGRHHAYGGKVMDKVLQRLAKVDDQPLFIYTHIMEPHAPYDRGKVTTGPAFDRYLSEIGEVDRQLGRVMKVLFSPRLRSRSTLIISADHGEAFGEHGTTKHTKTLYEELVRVPLIVKGVRVAQREVDMPVSLIDVGPTVLDIFGVETPPAHMGQSLVPILRGGSQPLERPLLAEGRLRRAYYSDQGIKVIIDLRRKVVEAYDLNADPDELLSLEDFDDPRVSEPLAHLQAFFDAHQIRREGYDLVFKP